MTFNLPWVRLEMRKSTYTQATYGRAKPKPAKAEKPNQISRALGKASAGFGRGPKKVGDRVHLAIPSRITGAQIPHLANHEGTKTVMLLVERFAKKSEHIGLKSYAVYALPVLAWIAGLILLRWGRLPLVAAPVGLVCGAVAGIGAWQLATLKLTTPMMTVQLQPGIWLALTPYVGLLAAAVRLILPRSSQ